MIIEEVCMSYSEPLFVKWFKFGDFKIYCNLLVWIAGVGVAWLNQWLDQDYDTQLDSLNGNEPS